MTDTLEVVARTDLGSSNSRRLRRAGMVPAILYGHGGECVPLAARRDAVEAMIRHGSRLVDLTGAVRESAVVRELQWDAMGSDPLHLDLLRVNKSERVKVRVPVDLKGECPGQRAGGTVNLVLHEIEVECTADAIPERVHAPVGGLEVGHVLKVRDLEMAPGVQPVLDAEETVVTCFVGGRKTAAAAEETTAEPEIIGRKAGEDGEAAEAAE